MNKNLPMPLKGIKVVELATVVAAPVAGRMLCSYGAELVKVESLNGDDLRHAGSFEGVVCEGDKNPLFTVPNSGKKLVSINLKSEEGMEAMMKLLSDADVFLTNVRKGGLKRLGLDYETLSEKFPQLIYAHFSGYGPNGPSATNPGFDTTAFWLRSGPMADWQVPGYFPFNPSYAFGDMATSSVLLSGILMAIIGREQTGKGTLVNTSLFASGIWCNSISVVSNQEQFDGKRSLDPMRPADPFSQYYLCKDGRWIGIFDNEYHREREKFAALFNLPELLTDPRYETLESLKESDAICEVVGKLNELFRTKDSSEWRAFLIENSVSCEVMRCARDVRSDPQAIENHYVEKVSYRDGLDVMMPCPPIHFSDYTRRAYKPAGVIGNDTQEVFRNMGYSDEEIEKMYENNIIK